ncbi:hypothetical protein EXIGLDRAFT_735899 [Exidia glandulosa HHB12029]|uniref:Ribosomal protein S6 n=1 Tax=Exidia glandulosa HHB12029 TaxID=1314781 RepID=A0A165JNV5_EXIGL|nr:hypothetical protein EXIGLDRAFT_735899 [Exidia glandulosa HHB12029]
MVLYQLMCITAHYREYQHIRGLVRKTAEHVLDNGGVVRHIRWDGTRSLPYKRVIDGHAHFLGDYWSMYFDASPFLMHRIDRELGKDPRVLKRGVVKIGSRLQDIVDFNPKTISQTAEIRVPIHAADKPRRQQQNTQ